MAIMILLFLDSAQSGMLKYVQNHFTMCLVSQAIEKTLNWLKPQNSPFQIWCSHYIFVNNISHFYPRIKILSFLDYAKARLLNSK